MADNVLFEVDAGQIVAKLHLAGIQNTQLKNIDTDFIVNTGIKNDDPKLKPDNPGKVTFDLKNSNGEYQVGLVTLIKYFKTYDLEKILNDITSLLAKTSGDNSKISDKAEDNEDNVKQIDGLKAQINAICKAKSIAEITDEQFADAEQMKKIKDDLIKKVGEDDEKAYAKVMDEAKAYAVKTLNSYMTAFAGSENYTKIADVSLGMINISDAVKNSNSNGLVKDFEIQPISDQESAKLVEQFKANYAKDPSGKNPNCEQKVCFFVKYTMNVDK